MRLCYVPYIFLDIYCLTVIENAKTGQNQKAFVDTYGLSKFFTHWDAFKTSLSHVKLCIVKSVSHQQCAILNLAVD